MLKFNRHEIEASFPRDHIRLAQWHYLAVALLFIYCDTEPVDASDQRCTAANEKLENNDTGPLHF